MKIATEKESQKNKEKFSDTKSLTIIDKNGVNPNTLFDSQIKEIQFNIVRINLRIHQINKDIKKAFEEN